MAGAAAHATANTMNPVPIPRTKPGKLRRLIVNCRLDGRASPQRLTIPPCSPRSVDHHSERLSKLIPDTSIDGNYRSDHADLMYQEK